jgi:hypothetical protein
MATHGLPCQLERVFKTLDDPLFLQRRKHHRAALQRLAEQDAGAVKILKTLFPADVGIHGGWQTDGTSVGATMRRGSSFDKR